MNFKINKYIFHSHSSEKFTQTYVRINVNVSGARDKWTVEAEKRMKSSSFMISAVGNKYFFVLF